MHSAEPPVWVPPKVIESLRSIGFATPPRYLEIASDLSPGDAIVDWLQRSAVGRPDVVLLGARPATACTGGPATSCETLLSRRGGRSAEAGAQARAA